MHHLHICVDTVALDIPNVVALRRRATQAGLTNVVVERCDVLARGFGLPPASLDGCLLFSFVASPRAMWAIVDSRARLAGEDLGPPGPVHRQARLGDFWIPQRGILATGQAYFAPLDPARHSSQTSRSATGADLVLRPSGASQAVGIPSGQSL